MPKILLLDSRSAEMPSKPTPQRLVPCARMAAEEALAMSATLEVSSQSRASGVTSTPREATTSRGTPPQMKMATLKRGSAVGWASWWYRRREEVREQPWEKFITPS